MNWTTHTLTSLALIAGGGGVSAHAELLLSESFLASPTGNDAGGV